MSNTHMQATRTRAGLRVVGRQARLLPFVLLTAFVFCHVARAQTPSAGTTLRLDVTVTNSRGEFVMGLAAKDFGVTLGGRLFSPSNRKEFDAALDAIAVELRHQYELGVRLGDEAAGKKPLAVKVKVNSPSDRQDLKRLRVRTRKAYLSKT